MLLYTFGDGQVLATTMYSDWAMSSYRDTKDDKVWLRDFINWVRFPDAAKKEYKNGDEVTLEVPVVNWSYEDASSIDARIVDPGGNTVATFANQNPGSLAAGDDRTIEVRYAIPEDNTSYGYYLVDYTLKNSAGAIIQNSFGKAAFVVSRFRTNESGFIYQESPIAASATSDRENYYEHETGNFTILVTNRTGSEQQATVCYYFPHHAERYWTKKEIYGTGDDPLTFFSLGKRYYSHFSGHQAQVGYGKCHLC